MKLSRFQKRGTNALIALGVGVLVVFLGIQAKAGDSRSSAEGDETTPLPAELSPPPGYPTPPPDLPTPAPLDYRLFPPPPEDTPSPITSVIINGVEVFSHLG